MGVRRLLSAAVLAVLCGVAAAPTGAVAQPVVEARSAAAFRDSIGVATHIVYYDTAYGDWPRVVAKLDELGVDHLRDGIYGNPDWRDWNERYYRAVELAAAHGKKFAFGMGEPNFRAGSLDQLIAVAGGRLRGAAEALEAPNEYDLFHGGPNWTTELRDYQQELYTKAKADPALRDLPVIGPSLVYGDSRDKLGSLASLMDVGNMHPYTGGEAPSQGHLERESALAAKVSGRKPLFATEVGFHNALSSRSGQPPVSEEVAASYLLRTYLEHFRAGVERTYAYELIDEKPDPALADAEQHFGLLRNDFSNKPAFTALKNLLQLVGRPAPVSAPRALGMTLEGETSGVQQLLLQRSDRSYTLVLWQEAREWDTKLRAPLPGLARRVSLTVPASSSIEAARPVVSGVSRPLPSEQGRVSLDVPADPLILQINLAEPPPTADAPGTDSGSAPFFPVDTGRPAEKPTEPAPSPDAPARCPDARAAGTFTRAGSQVRIQARRSRRRPLRVTFCAGRSGIVDVRLSRLSGRRGRAAQVLAARARRVAAGRQAALEVSWRRDARLRSARRRGHLRLLVRFRPTGGSTAVVLERRLPVSAVLPPR